jgi:hypothetical protein
MRNQLKTGKAGIGKTTSTRGKAANTNDARISDALMAVRILAQTYEQVGDRLLERMHNCGNNPRLARSLSRHLDWVGSRAQVINSFINAGDGAVTYLCSASEAERLTSLVHLTAHNAAADRLPVALFLMEKIDEELRLA